MKFKLRLRTMFLFCSNLFRVVIWYYFCYILSIELFFLKQVFLDVYWMDKTVFREVTICLCLTIITWIEFSYTIERVFPRALFESIFICHQSNHLSNFLIVITVALNRIQMENLIEWKKLFIVLKFIQKALKLPPEYYAQKLKYCYVNSIKTPSTKLEQSLSSTRILQCKKSAKKTIPFNMFLGRLYSYDISG